MADDQVHQAAPLDASIEKDTNGEATHFQQIESPAVNTPLEYDDPANTLPVGWMYRPRKFLAWTIPWYASPKFQLGMVSIVCFLCPGMYNALSGMGGGGRQDPHLGDEMVSA